MIEATLTVCWMSLAAAVGGAALCFTCFGSTNRRKVLVYLGMARDRRHFLRVFSTVMLVFVCGSGGVLRAQELEVAAEEQTATDAAGRVMTEISPTPAPPPPLAAGAVAKGEQETTDTHEGEPSGFAWKPAIEQSLLFLGVRHGVRIATEPRTRSELGGPLLEDYFRSVGNLGGWDDGDPFHINYVAHPLQGSVSGFIQIQNDPKGMRQKFSLSKDYWQSRLKAMGWSAASSVQWELGPISEAMIGNVGLPDTNRKKKRPGWPRNGGMGFVDLVVTPTLGTAELVAEDALDRYVVRWVERRTGNRFLRATARSAINPARSFANILRFKKPWHRDFR